MTKPHLIGLTGPAGCGKDTVRNLLESQFGYHGLALADTIYEMLLVMADAVNAPQAYLSRRDLKEETIPSLHASYRHLAQTLGTEWGRQMISPHLWTGIAEKRIEAITENTFAPVNIVVSDIRFQSEAEWIKSRGGVIWEIRRNAITSVRRHVSEDGVPDSYVDMIIHNNGTMGDLWNLVDSALEHTNAQS